MITQRITLNNVFSDYLTGNGFFHYLEETDVPWKNEDETFHTSLDMVYIGNHSGQKQVSPLVMNLLDNGILSDENKQKLAKAAYTMYGANWKKEYDTLSLKYDPISNYDMEETYDESKTSSGSKNTERTDNLSENITDTNTKTLDLTEATKDLRTVKHTTDINETSTEKGSDTDTRDINTSHGGTITENVDENTIPNVTQTTNNDVYGFNSDAGVPDDKSVVTRSGNEQHTVNKTTQDTTTIDEVHSGSIDKDYTSTKKGTDTENTENGGTLDVTNTGTDKDDRTIDKTNTGTQTINDNISGNENINHTLTRKGNIGVTTSQQMIQSERDLWLWNFFENVVFLDLDRLLTLPLYC